LPIIEIFIGVSLLGGLAIGYFVPKALRERRWANERATRGAMRVLSVAEYGYRGQDLDGNGIKDFWTADVAGLFKYGMISREIAEADAAPLVPLVPQPIPYHGYYFKALVADDSVSPPIVYRQVTDKKSGAVHNPDRFGFVAYPAGGLSPPKFMWIINENNTDFGGRTTVPVPDNWPADQQLKNSWSKVD
jgi:hypothetical protein